MNVPSINQSQRQHIIDHEHLRLLSIFHYVLGGITAAFSCLFIFHIIMGVLIATGRFGTGGPNGSGYMLVGMGSVALLVGWLFGAMSFFAGRCIARRQHRTFVYITAGLEFFNCPMGTMLGVSSFLVLLRPSVRELFDRKTDTTPSAQPLNIDQEDEAIWKELDKQIASGVQPPKDTIPETNHV